MAGDIQDVLQDGIDVPMAQMRPYAVLGAGRRQIMALVARQGATQVGIGGAVGIGLALAVSPVFAAAVERMHPASAPLILGIVGALGFVSIVAWLAPAHRASRIQVVRGLRAD